MKIVLPLVAVVIVVLIGMIVWIGSPRGGASFKPPRARWPTVARLKAFVADRGYEIAGVHEEEYLRGPGMLFAGDPAGYLTLLRYPVRKRAGAGAP